jgi:hypothetical protein
MLLKSLESGKTEVLSIVCSNGIEYVQDCIGNSGGWDHIDYDADNDCYTVAFDCDFDWWVSFCDREQAQSDAVEIARRVGLEEQATLNTDFIDLELYQKQYCEALKDALEDGELLKLLNINEMDEIEGAHADISEILNRKCFK